MKEALEGCVHATFHEKPGCANHGRVGGIHPVQIAIVYVNSIATLQPTCGLQVRTVAR